MSSAPESSWIRRHLGGSNSRQTWEERIGILVLVLGAAWAVWVGGALDLSKQIILWGLWLVALAVVARGGWLKLFGPVLFYDMVRTARRSRFILMRCGYALILFLVLFTVYQNRESYPTGKTAPAKQLSETATAFFSSFMIVQFIAVILLTPAYSAGAIAEEKERHTLEFLLATDLRNREIILSKLASRLTNLVLLILTGLPILSLTQFMGGVDPDLVLVVFAGTGMLLMSLVTASILCSVYSRKARNAIVLTYLALAGYLVIGGGLAIIVDVFPRASSWPVWFGEEPWTVEDLCNIYHAGNPFYVWIRMQIAVSEGPHLADVLPALMRNFAIFHVILTIGCATWAVLRVRAVALKETYDKPRRLSRREQKSKSRRRVGDWPMVWKEVVIESSFGLNWFGRILVVLLLLASLVPPVWIWIYAYIEWMDGSRTPFNWMPEAMNAYVRVVGAIVACLTWLGVAVRASSSISTEREKQTFDSLLTSPLRSTDILFGKWLGSILSVRWGWAWLALIWGIGIIGGGMNVLALPLVAGTWLVFAAFLGVLGLYFSMVSRTTLRANVTTLLLAILAGGVHNFIQVTCCLPLHFNSSGQNDPATLIWQFQLLALTPPVTLAWLSFRVEDFVHRPDEPIRWTFFALVGIAIWALAAVLLWILTRQRFERLTNRGAPLPRRRPPPLAPPTNPDEPAWVELVE